MGSMEPSHDLVVRTIREHASALLRTARRHSLCADDAHDAYQRAMEIFLRRAATVDPATVDRWLHVVVKHEAMAVRKARLELVAPEETDLDARPAERETDVDERIARWDRMARSAEALQRLKPQEVTALWLKAQGLSYAEIAERQQWTYTKVNRCLTEGRRAFLRRYAGIEAGEECERWAPVVAALVDGEASADQLAAARPHLRRCAACRATVRELRAAGPHLAGVLPAAGLAVASAGAAAPGGGRVEALVRALESAVVAVQERATAWALKAQMGAEAVTSTKVAAAASAAVVASGGAVTAVQVGAGGGERDGRGGERAAQRAPARAAATPAPARTVALVAPAATAPAPPARGPRERSSGAPGSGGGGRAREFAPRGRPAREFRAVRRPVERAPARRVEFRAPAPAAPAAPAPAGRAASAPEGASAGSAIVEGGRGGGEFGPG